MIFIKKKNHISYYPSAWKTAASRGYASGLNSQTDSKGK